MWHRLAAGVGHVAIGGVRGLRAQTCTKPQGRGVTAEGGVRRPPGADDKLGEALPGSGTHTSASHRTVASCKSRSTEGQLRGVGGPAVTSSPVLAGAAWVCSAVPDVWGKATTAFPPHVTCVREPSPLLTAEQPLPVPSTPSLRL